MRAALYFYFCVLLGTITHAGFGLAEDWPRFRGPNGAGVSSSRDLPETFGVEKNLLWKVDAGSGTSSPIVAGGRVYFTSFSGDDRALHCLNATSGKEIWRQTVSKIRSEIATPPNNPATCTPVCDGNLVCALFPDAGLCCFSNEGSVVWKKDLGPFYSMHGISSSLVVAEGRVIVCADQLKDPFLAAYGIRDGAELWKTDRLAGITGGYSTPSIFCDSDGSVQIVCSGPIEMAGYDAATGKKLWSAMGLTNAPIGAPVISGNRVFVCEPPGERIPMSVLADADKNNDGKIAQDEVKTNTAVFRLIERIEGAVGNGDGAVDQTEWDRAFETFLQRGGLACVELGGTGDVSKTHIRWQYTKATPHIPSVVIVDDVLYAVNDGGILLSFDARTGELLKRERLGGATGQYYASPIAADGKIFLTNVEGKVSVVQAGRPWRVLATNQLGEPTYATPAICDGRLYFRTEKSLFCFSAL